MTARPEKHSLTLRGHRTSVSLEAPFWEAFREIAAERGQGINALAAEIDEARGVSAGLASAIRVFVLDHNLQHCASKFTFEISRMLIERQRILIQI
ncbi:MAG: aryl-sulfate sulfotransferase [Rhodobacterales bacterium]|nr:MAG: aryl-sulfate sulfotransferase [Rhodobacterales bacterium]